MKRQTTNTRIYPIDNGWLLNHRGAGRNADAIHELIVFFKKSKDLIKEGGLNND